MKNLGDKVGQKPKTNPNQERKYFTATQLKLPLDSNKYQLSLNYENNSK